MKIFTGRSDVANGNNATLYDETDAFTCIRNLFMNFEVFISLKPLYFHENHDVIIIRKMKNISIEIINYWRNHSGACGTLLKESTVLREKNARHYRGRRNSLMRK